MILKGQVHVIVSCCWIGQQSTQYAVQDKSQVYIDRLKLLVNMQVNV